MVIEESIFNKYVFDNNELLKYGFKLVNKDYSYEKEIFESSFKIVIDINSNNIVVGKIYDLDSLDIYTNYRIENNVGEFAGKIRNEFISLLIDIRDNCCITNLFISVQGNRICRLIKKKYGDDTCFEWESDPNSGVFKNSKTKKWYALIMNVSKEKFRF